MKVEQIYTGCLAQGAYYIRSGQEAAIIDPLREVEPYLERAKADGVTIRYIFETHFHADFVSGHIDLADATGATIVYGPGAEPKFDAYVAHDGEVLRLGDVTIRLLHTPGHTLESTTFLLKDERGKDYAIFSGDTLFLGDVGRPDLAQQSARMTREDLAGLLYDSLRAKILPLHDDVLVYPAHGAGSACGKNMMNETVDTLGNQKRTNYALRGNMTREEFIAEVTEGLLPPPAYFPENVRMNREGYTSINHVLKQGVRALAPAAFAALTHDRGALVLDTRDARSFAQGFIPGSVNIGLDGNFAPWVGALVPGVNHPLLIVAEEGREAEVVTRLARVGYDNALGYLAGGFNAWFREGYETDAVANIAAPEFAQLHQQEHVHVIDVRRAEEYRTQHVQGAINIPLDYLNQHLAEIPRTGDVYVYCAGGYRSMTALSMLKARGWDNLIDVAGGFKALTLTAVPFTKYACALSRKR